MGWDEEVVSGSQDSGLEFILEAQAGAPREEYHPFIRVLVIPLPRGSGLAAGHNTFQAEITRLQKHLKDFPGEVGRNWGKEIGSHFKTDLGFILNYPKDLR